MRCCAAHALTEACKGMAAAASYMQHMQCGKLTTRRPSGQPPCPGCGRRASSCTLARAVSAHASGATEASAIRIPGAQAQVSKLQRVAMLMAGVGLRTYVPQPRHLILGDSQRAVLPCITSDAFYRHIQMEGSPCSVMAVRT